MKPPRKAAERLPPDNTMHFARLEGCARCGGDHVDLTLQPLTQPIEPDYRCADVGRCEAAGHAHPRWTHWAPCPKNGEPILGRDD